MVDYRLVLGGAFADRRAGTGAAFPFAGVADRSAESVPLPCHLPAIHESVVRL